jgi:chromate transport protein ChrA
MGKIFTGFLYLAITGLAVTMPPIGILVIIGILYDFLTLNEQLSELNSEY